MKATNDKLKLLEDLSLAFGPSGREDGVADIIRSEISGLCDSFYTDRIGDVIAVIHGTAGGSPQRMLLSAHMDEVGFMITGIEDNGYLRFSNIGGIDSNVLCGRRITISNGNKKLPAIIASKPIHMQSEDERGEVTPPDKMYMDIGAKSKADAEELCHIGDYATFDSDFIYFGESNRRIKGKAIDDRLGCAALIDVMRGIFHGSRPNFDLYFAFTVREEVGSSGAGAVAYSVAPAYSIVIESTAVADIAGVTENERVAILGGGGVLSLIDKGTVYDRDFVDFALNCAKKHNINCQIKRYISGANDAACIHKSRSGVKTIAISAPVRYLHSASCVADTSDYFSITALIGAIIGDINITINKV
jgi:endoglucanase